MIPTFQQCKEKVKACAGFTYKADQVDGNTFHIFSYRLASHSDFKKYDGFEMRGLTFLEKDGKYIAYPHLHKFFNVNQEGQENQFNVLKKKKMSYYQDKEDGSMLVPIMVAGVIYWKTKLSFVTEQAVMAQKIMEQNPKLEVFIRSVYKAGDIPIFELTSPLNKIVLEYDQSELRLLQVRNRETGVYRDMVEYDKGLKNFKWDEIKRAKFHTDKTLEELMESKKTEEGNEGYVVTFEDGHFAKVKTDWYCVQHRLLTEDLNSENFIIEQVLEETLDDTIAQVKINDKRKEWALEIAKHIQNEVNLITTELQKTFKHCFKWNRKTIAQSYCKKFRYFGMLMKMVDFYESEGEFMLDEILFGMIKEYILKETYKLERARFWLKHTGFKSKVMEKL